ncbi:MAG: CHAT domain-containing protein [Methylacidiphilales bacterium]|nr:CHAT domain-containing protein [Candidatus Methylacidiphilales bacterium]
MKPALFLFLALLSVHPAAPTSIDWQTRYQEVSQLEKSGQADQAQALAENIASEAENRVGPQSSELVPVLKELSQLYLRRHLYPKAEALLQRMLEIQEKNFGPDDPKTADAVSDLGWYYQNMADYPRARKLLQRSLEIREAKLGRRHEAVADSLNSLGVLSENLGEFKQSEQYYLEALQIRRELLGPDHPSTGTTTNNLATLYWSLGDYGRAEQYFNEALRIREKDFGPLALSTATSMNNLALLYRSMGDYSRARPLYLKVLAIREAKLGPEHPFTLTTVHQLALLYADLGDYPKAEQLLLRAVRGREKVFGSEHPDTARSLFHLAWLYDREKEYDQAEPLHLKALALRIKVLGEKHPETAGSYGYLARHYHLQGKLAEAEPLYKKALDLQIQLLGENAPDTLKTVENLACLYLDENKPDLSLSYARKAMQTRESMLQNLFTFTSEHQRIDFQKTLSLYNLPASLGNPDDIARVAFRTKGVVLDSMIEDQIAARASKDPDVARLFDQLQSVSRRLLRAEMRLPEDPGATPPGGGSELEKLQQEENVLQAGFARKISGNSSARRALQIDPGQIRKAIPKNSVLIEWLRYEAYQKNLQTKTAYGALVLAPGMPDRWVPLGDAAEIDSLVRSYQKYMHHRVRDAAVDRVTSDLSEKTWAPLASVFPPGTEQVILSPDGPLNFVSFAALPMQDGRFWAEKYFFTYVSSGRDLLRKNQPPANDQKIAVFANPDYKLRTAPANAIPAVASGGDLLRQFDGIELSPLSGSEDEARFLVQRSVPWKCDTVCYLGKQATESNLSALHSPLVLHMATHGLFLPEPGSPVVSSVPDRSGNPKPSIVLADPMQRSMLLLAGAQRTFDAWQKGIVPPTENDGIVSAGEVGGLDLQGTWLVVLSACDTGQGEARAGEGVLGLRRGFVMAGAQNLLLTLWPVGDSETVSLMESFYDKAFETRDAPRALALVQRERLELLRKKYGLGQAIRLSGPFILSF